jgi:callose synthase
MELHRCIQQEQWTHKLWVCAYRVRFHYGHPDVFDRLFHITRGGMSKASRVINLSEDIFAGWPLLHSDRNSESSCFAAGRLRLRLHIFSWCRGCSRGKLVSWCTVICAHSYTNTLKVCWLNSETGFNSILRRGNVTHHEYIQVGKGRDVGLNQISLFEAKIANGNGEQSLSRDMYRLGHRFDFFRMLSAYFTTVGYYFSTMVSTLLHCGMYFIHKLKWRTTSLNVAGGMCSWW